MPTRVLNKKSHRTDARSCAEVDSARHPRTLWSRLHAGLPNGVAENFDMAAPSPTLTAAQVAAEAAAGSLDAYFKATPHPSAGGGMPRSLSEARAAEVRAVGGQYEPMAVSIARNLYEAARSASHCGYCSTEAKAALARLPAILCPHCRKTVA